MSNEEIKQIAKEVAREALREIMFEGKDKRFHNTRLLMRNYNTLKEHLNNSESIEIKFNFIDECEVKVDHMWLESIARSKTRTAKMLEYIDVALVNLKTKFMEKGEFEKYRSFEMFFIEEKTSEDIQEEFNCGKNTPKRWNDIVTRELSVLLWGIDALGI